MKHNLGWYFPDGEIHLPEWMAKTRQMRNGVHQYQFVKYQTALKFCRSRPRLAVDVGAHVGQWSKNMAIDFESVAAFEPVPDYAKCWRKNMEDVRNATLYPVAIGEADGIVSLTCGTPGSYGDTFIAQKEEGNVAVDVQMHTLDSFDLQCVDFIKVDCEGYELFVLKGGERTIVRDKPCIIVEQKPGRAQKFGIKETEAVDLLQSWGAKLNAVMSGDYVLSWE